MASTLVTIEKKTGRRPWYRSPKLIRQGAMLFFFFLFLLHVAYDHQVKGGGPRGAPSVEAYCPFGGLESLYQFLTTGGFVRRIEPSALILFAALVLLTLVASRGFCGWICPFGSVEVKGFMTLNEIALKTGVPKEQILSTLGLTGAVDGRAPVREWMHGHGKTIQDLRDAVAPYRHTNGGQSGKQD